MNDAKKVVGAAFRRPIERGDRAPTQRLAMNTLKKISFIFLWLFLVGGLVFIFIWSYRKVEEKRVLRAVIDRLSADSRIAEVLVTQSRYDEATRQIETTIKFLEYDVDAKPLLPRYFTFQGSIIQFQTLVVRFQDRFVKAGDKARGKSAYLFLKVFMLGGKVNQIYDLVKADEIPGGYKVPGVTNEIEKELWREFWAYALDPKMRERAGIKNAQIEAPGTMFVPGTIYTLRIEHDGGIRIDGSPIPEIVKGELGSKPPHVSPPQ